MSTPSASPSSANSCQSIPRWLKSHLGRVPPSVIRMGPLTTSLSDAPSRLVPTPIPLELINSFPLVEESTLPLIFRDPADRLSVTVRSFTVLALSSAAPVNTLGKSAAASSSVRNTEPNILLLGAARLGLRTPFARASRTDRGSPNGNSSEGPES
eukprot:1196242-Prorocentrum_minimum.AAC.4